MLCSIGGAVGKHWAPNYTTDPARPGLAEIHDSARSTRPIQQTSSPHNTALIFLGVGRWTLWVGEDITSVSGETPAKTTTTPGTYTLKTDGDDWVKVLKYIEANKKLGLEQIVKNLQNS